MSGERMKTDDMQQSLPLDFPDGGNEEASTDGADSEKNAQAILEL